MSWIDDAQRQICALGLERARVELQEAQERLRKVVAEADVAEMVRAEVVRNAAVNGVKPVVTS